MGRPLRRRIQTRRRRDSPAGRPRPFLALDAERIQRHLQSGWRHRRHAGAAVRIRRAAEPRVQPLRPHGLPFRRMACGGWYGIRRRRRSRESGGRRGSFRRDALCGLGEERLRGRVCGERRRGRYGCARARVRAQRGTPRVRFLVRRAFLRRMARPGREHTRRWRARRRFDGRAGRDRHARGAVDAERIRCLLFRGFWRCGRNGAGDAWLRRSGGAGDKRLCARRLRVCRMEDGGWRRVRRRRGGIESDGGCVGLGFARGAVEAGRLLSRVCRERRRGGNAGAGVRLRRGAAAFDQLLHARRAFVCRLGGDSRRRVALRRRRDGRESRERRRRDGDASCGLDAERIRGPVRGGRRRRRNGRTCA